MTKKPELLAPAGNLKKFKYALAYGADAIYCGLPDFSLRYRINDFTLNDLKKGIILAHAQKKKVYVTINIYPHKKHLNKLPTYIKKLKDLQPDALIVSDPGILLVIKKYWPKAIIHLSTQANCTNWQSAKFWFDQGVKRIILARETTLEDIKEIHKKVPKVELETFVHGAMCMAYSGRCILSKWLTDRSANLGDCSQPCRWDYNVYLEETNRPGAHFPIEEDQHGTYIMNSKDLCLIEYLEQLKKAGVSSFKIEGRAKSIYYLANTIHAYRQAMDNPRSNKKLLVEELKKAQYRGFTTGFILGKETVEQRINSAHENVPWEFCGEVLSYDHGQARVRVHNTIRLNDHLEIIVPHGKTITHWLTNLLDSKQQPLTEAHGGQITEVLIPLKEKLPPMSIIRRKIK